MSSPYEAYSRLKSHTMFGMCVLFTVVILVVLGLVTGFLTFKGYKGVLAHPAHVRATVISVADPEKGSTQRMLLVSVLPEDGGPAAETRYVVGSGTSIIIDRKSKGPQDLKAGMLVNLRYSSADPGTATTIAAIPKGIEGVVSSVQGETLTFRQASDGNMTVTIPTDAQISIKNKQFATLRDLEPGSPVRLEMSAVESSRVIALDSPIPAASPELREVPGRIIPPIVSEDPHPAPLDPSYPGGLRNGIVGTLILIGLACLVGIPVGMLAGVYLAEYSSNSMLAGSVRFIADVLTGVPSIVVGILGYELLVRPLKGPNGFAGSLALAFIMIPLVARTTEEMLRLVPRSYREASVALGATKARTILKVVLPAAAGSVITGIMLAIARVAGETAPLLFTVVGLDALELNPKHQFPALTLQIYKDATAADDQLNRLAWAGILILLALIFVLNVVVRSTAKAMAGAKTAA